MMRDEKSTNIINGLKNKLNEKEQRHDKTRSFYWTKKDPVIAAKIIKNFLPEGGIVLDPFLGSGSTIYSLNHLEKRYSVIGVEINEMPLSQIKFNILERTDEEITLAIEEMTKFIHQYAYLYEYTIDDSKMKLIKTILDIEDGQVIPKIFTYIENGERKIIKKGDKLFSQFALKYIERQKEISLLIDEDLLLDYNSRIAIKKDMKLSDIFSSLSFYILIQYKKNLGKSDFAKYAVTQILHKAKYTDIRTQSQFPYWIPKSDVVDRNILTELNKTIIEIQKDVQESYNLFKSNNKYQNIGNTENQYISDKHKITLINKPIQEISSNDIDENSVDLVLTDPPYFDQVAYSEYLKIWEFFTGYKSNLLDEIVVSNRLNGGMNRLNYIKSMKKTFMNVRKAMKNNSYCLIYFKDSKLNNLNDIINIFIESKFEFVGQFHVTKSKYTYKQNNSPESTVAGDCLMIFKKTEEEVKIPDKKDFDGTARAKIIDKIKNYINSNGPSEIGEIYDNFLIKYLFENGLLHNFTKSKQIFDILTETFGYDPETRQIYEILS
jgi:DNA modification methylase